jgi:hypothetical protein
MQPVLAEVFALQKACQATHVQGRKIGENTENIQGLSQKSCVFKDKNNIVYGITFGLSHDINGNYCCI